MNTIYSYLIVEDEKHQQDMLTSLLKGFADLHLVGIASDLQEAELMIKEHKPDLVFMDVLLPPDNSLDLLQSLPSIDFDIIFTTSYEKFALAAFRLAAVDYLTKPIVKEELKEAVNRFKLKQRSKEDDKHLKVLLDNLTATKADYARIALPTMAGFNFIPIKEIVRCESDNTYTTFHLVDKRELIVSRTLKECEQMLTDYRFYRVHNSHLVNLDFVTEYIRGEGGQVKLADGTCVDVSRRRKEEFLINLKNG